MRVEGIPQEVPVSDAVDLALLLLETRPQTVIYDSCRPDLSRLVSARSCFNDPQRALREVCAQADLDAIMAAEAVYVSTPGRVAAAKRVNNIQSTGIPETDRRLQRVISFCFPGESQSVQEIIDFLGALAGDKVTSRLNLPDGAVIQAEVRIVDMRLHNALYWIAVVSDSDLVLEDGMIVFVPRAKGKDGK